MTINIPQASQEDIGSVHNHFVEFIFPSCLPDSKKRGYYNFRAVIFKENFLVFVKPNYNELFQAFSTFSLTEREAPVLSSENTLRGDPSRKRTLTSTKMKHALI